MYRQTNVQTDGIGLAKGSTTCISSHNRQHNWSLQKLVLDHLLQFRQTTNIGTWYTRCLLQIQQLNGLRSWPLGDSASGVLRWKNVLHHLTYDVLVLSRWKTNCVTGDVVDGRQPFHFQQLSQYWVQSTFTPSSTYIRLVKMSLETSTNTTSDLSKVHLAWSRRSVKT